MHSLIQVYRKFLEICKERGYNGNFPKEPTCYIFDEPLLVWVEKENLKYSYFVARLDFDVWDKEIN